MKIKLLEYLQEKLKIGDRVKLLGYFNGEKGTIINIIEDPIPDDTLYVIKLDNVIYNPNPIRGVKLPSRNLKKINENMKHLHEFNEEHTREPGFYWVKNNNQWVVAQWEWDEWFIPGSDLVYEDSNFNEIDEKQLVRQENKTNSRSERPEVSDIIY